MLGPAGLTPTLLRSPLFPVFIGSLTPPALFARPAFGGRPAPLLFSNSPCDSGRARTPRRSHPRRLMGRLWAPLAPWRLPLRGSRRRSFRQSGSPWPFRALGTRTGRIDQERTCISDVGESNDCVACCVTTDRGSRGFRSEGRLPDAGCALGARVLVRPCCCNARRALRGSWAGSPAAAAAPTASTQWARSEAQPGLHFLQGVLWALTLGFPAPSFNPEAATARSRDTARRNCVHVGVERIGQ